jgi:Zn finger protein HypA/HybF involved in hydrogenase expression
MAKKRYTVVDSSVPRLKIKCKSCKNELTVLDVIGVQEEENEIVRCPKCGVINHNVLNKKEIVINMDQGEE